MIWLMTIVTFLGAVVADMLVFLFFFQREQIRAALRKPEQQRMEARIPTRVAAPPTGKTLLQTIASIAATISNETGTSNSVIATLP